MKKAFTLFSTLILIFMFSILAITIFETKSISYVNIQNQHQYIQAKNHIRFLEEYIKSLNDFEVLDKIEIIERDFNIYANIKKKDSYYEAFLYVKSKLHNISLHKKLIIK
jgi:hypothetical protein